MEDWKLLLSFMPDNWDKLALETGVLKGLHKDKDVEKYLRTLLLHVGCGHSLRETVARAKLAGLADISDVALFKRLIKAKDWLHGMCVELFEERGIVVRNESDFQFRLFDATNVKEPGKTGSLWRIHYCVQFPSLACDFFKLSATKGRGTGESFFQYPIKQGDHIIADRGYSTASGIHHVVSRKAFVIVRVNTNLPLNHLKGQRFSLLDEVMRVKKPGSVKSWRVRVPHRADAGVPGRICVIRKTEEAIKLAHKKLKMNASKKGHSIKPATLEFAKYVIVFTNYPEESFSDVDVLNGYRCRWQVELVFKRFKSMAELGHLPKHGGDSSKAWLYGKLFVVLLTEKLIRHAESVSPWGYLLEEGPTEKHLA